MKKLLFTAAIAVLGFTSVNAQDDATTGGFAKEDVYVSGTVGFGSTSYDGESSSSFEFSPSVGYFVTDNIAVELGLIVGSTKDAVDNKTSDFGSTLGANYFFTPANQFSFTVGAGLTYVSSKDSPKVGGDSTVNTFGFAVAPGLNYFVSNNFALRASIGALSYTSTKEDVKDAKAENNFGLNLDLSDINFGVTYKF